MVSKLLSCLYALALVFALVVSTWAMLASDMGMWWLVSCVGILGIAVYVRFVRTTWPIRVKRLIEVFVGITGAWLLIFLCALWFFLWLPTTMWAVIPCITVACVITAAALWWLTGLLDRVGVLRRVLTYFAISLMFILFWACAFESRGHPRRAECVNNLTQIALSLLNYESRHGHLPPACTCDKDGRPMHSWRVLILPDLEGKGLYDKYHFDERWDGPHNETLLAVRPAIFACPSNEPLTGESATHTSYFAPVGVKTVWGKQESQNGDNRQADHLASSTVLVIELADRNIDWTQPEDLRVDDLGKVADPDEAILTRNAHVNRHGYLFHDTHVSHVALADGSVFLLVTDNLTAERLENLCAVGGFHGDDVSKYGYYGYDYYNAGRLLVNWAHAAIFATWLASVVLLLHWAVRGRAMHDACIARQNAN